MSTAPLREIKPVVVPAQFVVLGPLVAGFVAVFPATFAFVVGGMFGDPFERLERGPDHSLAVGVYVAAFMIALGLFGLKCFQEPQQTTYRVFADRVECDEGFFNKHQRTVVFDQVIDVELTEGVLQQTRGAGTVSLVTQQLVSGSDGKLSNRKVALVNVPQPREVYDLIRSLALKKT
ncbi:PH domain-containing protein [Urbifossiella limnaea]|uniref:Bacterial membrane flanked domain protein n=1 Tax=Urbifossiella limnaea TaxID=2528023 RepID=A0A517Y2T4_9BACT|nr:PH domain-containing protein [Urbifossiella limnaea]QDU24103.1 Bacterial membrane flanked domain protein [Urbifossiella limnaea]